MKCRVFSPSGNFLCGKGPCEFAIVHASGAVPTPLCGEHMTYTMQLNRGDVLRELTPDEVNVVLAAEVLES